jgi:hypothetical protein
MADGTRVREYPRVRMAFLGCLAIEELAGSRMAASGHEQPIDACR